MAAGEGKLEVMNKLLDRNADPGAIDEIGPLVNHAIMSGNQKAVEMIVEKGVPLSLDQDDIWQPLALAATFSDFSMFEYIITKCADKLPGEQYSIALINAAGAGRVDVFKRLLEYEHDQAYYQRALERATEEENWDIANLILKYCDDLDCDQLFYKVAAGIEPKDKLLEDIWKHTGGKITPEFLNKSLYEATDGKKESTVKLLLDSFKADPNATGDG
jgi:hypothetical protein